ncbi:MAG: DsbA family protein [Rhodobacterales bacterium]|nr:DsbA family protein [Rhodobacterales bacterium]
MTPILGRRATLAGLAGLGLAAVLSAAALAQNVPVVEELALGAADAPVTVVEYASYTCPHCAAFHAQVFKPLKADYIDTGKVRFIFREVYFDRYGLWAAMVARCAGVDRYFGLSGLLFDRQREWATAADATGVVAQLKTIGKVAGLDDATLDACLKDGAKAEALVADFQAKTTADGIDSTPTLIVNGTKHSNMGYEDLKKIIDQALAG